jgi:hypothetical protein
VLHQRHGGREGNYGPGGLLACPRGWGTRLQRDTGRPLNTILNSSFETSMVKTHLECLLVRTGLNFFKLVFYSLYKIIKNFY